MRFLVGFRFFLGLDWPWLIFLGLCSLSSCSATDISIGVRNGTQGTYCVLLESSKISGTITYIHPKTNASVNYPFTLDSASMNSSGNCTASETSQLVTVMFLPKEVSAPTKDSRWQFNLTFTEQDKKPGTFKIKDYKLSVKFNPPEAFGVPKEMGNQTFNYSMDKSANLEWEATDRAGFKCSKTGLALDNSSFVQFEGIRVIAFASLPEQKFPDNELFEQCRIDSRTSDLIPIIVGACLAGLVIIVLIAYLIGRARAKREGYASV